MDLAHIISPEIIQGLDPMRYATAIVMAFGLVAFFYFCTALYYLRYRKISDSPTSKIRSAAQGYVELEGIQFPFQNVPLQGPLSRKPCTWYRYMVEKRQGDKWVKIEEEISSALILFKDTTGECVIDPEGAKIIPAIKESVRRPNYMQRLEYSSQSYFSFAGEEYAYTEWRMEPGSIIYVVGNYRTLGGADTASTTEENNAVALILKDWKKNTKALLAKYDTNKDGNISQEEWEWVVKDAQKELKQHSYSPDKDLRVNLVSKDGLSKRQPYLISNYRQAYTEFTYKVYTLLFMLASFCSSCLFIWLIIARLMPKA